MEEKYLYGNKVLNRADIEEGAKASGLDVDTYLSKAGIRTIQDSYDYNGKTLGANDVVEGATASNLDFDTYLSKAGIKPISATPAAQPVAQEGDIYNTLGIERNEVAKTLTGDATVKEEYKFKDPWKQKVYDNTKVELENLNKQLAQEKEKGMPYSYTMTLEKEIEKKSKQLEKAVVNEQWEDKDNYIPLYDIQEKKKVTVPKGDTNKVMNDFIASSGLKERGEEFIVPFENMNPDAQRVVLYNFNQKYMPEDKFNDWLEESNYTTDQGGARKAKNAVQNLESGVMEGVGSFVEYYGQQLNHPLKDGINQLVLEANIGAVTEKEFNDRLNKLITSAENDPGYGSRVIKDVAELSIPTNAGANPMQSIFKPAGLAESADAAAKAEFENIKANLPTFKSAQEGDGVFYKDQLGDDVIDQAKGVADFGKTWLKTNPKYNDDMLWGVAPKALGSSVPYMAIGAATGKLGAEYASSALIAMMGHHQMAADAYNEAIQQGATGRDAILASMINGGMGMTEAIPIADLYTRLAKGSSGRLWNALIQGAEETTQETMQQIVGNITAQQLYDESRGVMDGVVEAAQASFLVGGLMGGLIYSKRQDASKSDLAILDRLDAQRKVALQNAADAPKGSAINLATGEVILPEEINLGKTDGEPSMRDALSEDLLASEPVVQPQTMDEIPEGWDVSYQGISGTLVRGDDGVYIKTDDNVNILVEGGLSDSTPEELGLEVSQPITKATVRAKTKERTRNYNVEYKDGNKYFVSLDHPTNPDGQGDKVFKVNDDGTMTEMFYGRKANVNKKLAIINKALDASGLPARNSDKPSVEEKNIIQQQEEADEKKAKEPKKEGEEKKPEEDKTEPMVVTLPINDVPEAAIKIDTQSGITSAATDESIPNRVQNKPDTNTNSVENTPVEKTDEQKVAEQKVEKTQQKAQEKSTTKKKTNNPEVTQEVKKTRSANTLVGGDTVYDVDVAEDGFSEKESLIKYMKENPDAESVTITQELHDTIWPKKKVEMAATGEAHNKKFTDDIRLLETTKSPDKKADGMYARISDAETKGYITEAEAEAQRKQVADIITKRRKKDDIEQVDKMLKSEAIKALQRLKFREDNTPDRIYSMIIPMPTTKQAKLAWNAAIDLAVGAVRVGTKIVDAIEVAIEFLREKGYKITGKQKADLLKNIEKEAGVYSPKNQIQLQRVLQKVFNLPAAQAKLVAGVADRMALAYQQMGAIVEKNDYYTYLLPGISEAKNLDEALMQVSKTLDPNIEIINGFYSPIQQRLLEQKQEKFSAKKWMEIVGNKDEAKFTGVYAMLAAKKPDEQVHRNEIMQWMRDNRIEIVEVVKGEPTEMDIQTLMDDEVGQGMSRQEAIEYLLNEEGATKFENYQLEGEKTGYKEVLITLPFEEKNKKLSKWEYYDSVGISKDVFETLDTRRKNELFNEWKDYDDSFGKANHAQNKSVFKSFHFEELNIIAHLRMNIRTSATGEKILFLEEIQSDWGQNGKKEGFILNELPKGYEVVEVTGGENKGRFWVKDKDGRAVSTMRDYNAAPGVTKPLYSNTKEDAVSAAISDLRKINNIPVAPFVTDTNSWVKLGLKFALQHAIKEGATSIAWTTGEQQNERYDLSKSVDKITSTKTPHGKQIYVLLKNNDDFVLHVDNSGVVNDYTKNELIGNPTGKTLDEFIGKDLADRILTSENNNDEYSGEGLKVKGKGMIGFYGSPTDGKLGIVGNVAESLFGKGSVKEISIGGKKGSITRAQALSLIIDGKKVFTELRGEEFPLNTVGDVMEANNYYVKNSDSKVLITQHSISITPEMKSEVERGLPLFQGDKGYFVPSQRVIGAISNPDISSPLHELSHAFFDDVIKLMTQGNEMAFELYSDFQEFARSEEGKKFYNEWKGTYDFGKKFDPDNYVFLQELFARGFEQYLTTGKSNAKESVKGLFEAIKDFMVEIYNGIVEGVLDINLSDKMISVYDKMMGLDVAYFEGVTPVAESGGGVKTIFQQAKDAKDKNEFLSELITGELRYKNRRGEGFDNLVKKEPIGRFSPTKLKNKILAEQSVDREVVDAWKDAIKDGKLPVVIVEKIGETESVADGHHKLKAYQELGIKEVPVVSKEDLSKFYDESVKQKQPTKLSIDINPARVLKQTVKKAKSTYGLNVKEWNALLTDIQNDYKITQDVRLSIDNSVAKVRVNVDKVALAAELNMLLESPEAMSRKSFSNLRQDIKSMLRGSRDEKARIADIRSALTDWIRMNRKQLNAAGAKLTTSAITRVNNIKKETDVDNVIDYLQRILDDADFRKLEQQREKAKAKLMFLLDPKTYIFKKNSVARGKKVDADTIDYLKTLHYNAVNMSRAAALTRMADIVNLLSGNATLNGNPQIPTPQQQAELQQELIDISFSGAEDMDLYELNVAIQAAEDIVEQGKQALDAEKTARKNERDAFRTKMLEVLTDKGKAKKKGEQNIAQDFLTKEGNDFHSIQDKLSIYEKDTDTMNSTLEQKHGRAARNAEVGENVDQLKIFKAIGSKIVELLGNEAITFGGGSGVKAAMLKSKQFAKIFKRMAVQNYLKALSEDMHTVTYNDASGTARTEELSMNQMAYAWGLWRNSESRENLKIEGVQRGQEFFDAIDQKLSQGMKNYVDYLMNDLMPSMHPYLNEVYKQMYGLNLTKLDNYLPQRVVNKPDSTKSYDLWDDFSMGNISPAAVKSRVMHGQELAVLDINKVVKQYVTQAIKFRHWAIPIKEMMLFYNNQDVVKAINDFHGNVYNQMINLYMQHWKGATMNVGTRLIDQLRKNTTIGLLGLKPVIAVYQMVNSPSYMAAIPVAEYAKLSGKLFSGIWDGDTQAKIKYLLDSDYFQQRFNTGDMYEVKELMDRTKVKMLNGKLTYSEMMTFMIRLGDAGAIILGGYPVFEYNYRKAKKSGATDAEAKKIAVDKWADATEYLQQSSLSSRRSVLESNQFAKLITMFASQPRQYHRLAAAAARNIIAGKGDFKHNLKTLLICHVIMPSLYQLAANGFDWDNEDQLTAALIGNFNSIMILGQLISGAAQVATGRQVFDINTPVLSMLQNILFGFQKLSAAADEEKDWSHDDTMQTMYLFARGLTPVVPLPTGAGSNYWNMYKDKKAGNDIYREPFRIGGWSQDNLEHTDRAKKVLLETRQKEQKKKLMEEDKWQEDMEWSTINNKYMTGFAKKKSDAWLRTKKQFDEKINQEDFYYDGDVDMWYKKE